MNNGDYKEANHRCEVILEKTAIIILGSVQGRDRNNARKKMGTPKLMTFRGTSSSMTSLPNKMDLECPYQFAIEGSPVH